MLRVPVPLVCAAESSGIEMLFCCALAPTMEDKTRETPGSTGARPWLARLNERESTVNVAWYDEPEGGVNATWKLTVCPGEIWTGSVSPGSSLKATPERATFWTVTFEAEGFESTKPCERVDPAVTDPKLMTAPAESGVWLPDSETVAACAAAPWRTMLILFTARKALNEPLRDGVKLTSNSTSDAGPV